ncbi:MAG: arylesterase [Pseudomonadota bacterium]|nr:arylesterase [Pseudomonadota bacterium]
MLLLLVTLLMLDPVTARAESRRIVMLGDSITAGYGLPPGDALPVRLQQALADKGLAATVENAGVSGDTTAGGLSRLDWAVQGTPDLVIVALGANDGLRGIDPAETRRNLAAIVQRLKQRNIPVLIAGMYAPRNLGADFTAAYDRVFTDVASAENVPLYPFLLEGVATDPALNQSDGIHPNAEGARRIAERLADAVISTF